MIGIIDYNAGNITSVKHALESIGAPYILSKNPAELKNVDRIIFPGVGDAAYAMEQLKETGFDSFLKEWAQEGKPILGICLGSQIIFDFSEEGNVECLGLIPGTIRHLSKIWEERLPSEAEREASEFEMLQNNNKVPHMGWNDVTVCNGGSPILKDVPSNSDFYFVHSYVIQPKNPEVIKGYANYGTLIPSVIQHNNIYACQFHPEKSGKAGLKILENFCKLSEIKSPNKAECNATQGGSSC